MNIAPLSNRLEDSGGVHSSFCYAADVFPYSASEAESPFRAGCFPFAFLAKNVPPPEAPLEEIEPPLFFRISPLPPLLPMAFYAAISLSGRVLSSGERLFSFQPASYMRAVPPLPAYVT